MYTVSFHLKPKSPFRLDLTVWVLRRQPHNRVDFWDGRVYSRVLVLDDTLVKIEVSQPGPDRIRVDASTVSKDLSKRLRSLVIPLIEKMLNIRDDMRGFHAAAARNELLSPLAAEFRGFRPPRFPSVFEALVNAVACQQVSLPVAIQLLNRLAESHGLPWNEAGDSRHAFPLPRDLAAADVIAIRNLGFNMNKAKTIISISRSAAGNESGFERAALLDDDEAVQYLERTKGIGRWSAEYVLLRGLGRIHVFPGNDAGARKSLQELLRLRQRPDADRVRELTVLWQPYAGMYYFHFLLNKLKKRGFFS